MQCSAHSKQSGKQCGRDAIKGGRVCHVHGGSAPQVRAAAQARLLALVDPALAELSNLLKAKQESARLGAVKDVLDRAGLKEAQKIELDATVTEKQFDFSKLTSEQLDSVLKMLEQAAKTEE